MNTSTVWDAGALALALLPFVGSSLLWSEKDQIVRSNNSHSLQYEATVEKPLDHYGHNDHMLIYDARIINLESLLWPERGQIVDDNLVASDVVCLRQSVLKVDRPPVDRLGKGVSRCGTDQSPDLNYDDHMIHSARSYDHDMSHPMIIYASAWLRSHFG